MTSKHQHSCNMMKMFDIFFIVTCVCANTLTHKHTPLSPTMVSWDDDKITDRVFFFFFYWRALRRSWPPLIQPFPASLSARHTVSDLKSPQAKLRIYYSALDLLKSLIVDQTVCGAGRNEYVDQDLTVGSLPQMVRGAGSTKVQEPSSVMMLTRATSQFVHHVLGNLFFFLSLLWQPSPEHQNS